MPFDEIDDIFKMMNRIFERDTPTSSDISKYIDYRASERIIDDDCIYYTVVLKDVNKSELDVKPYEDRIHIDIKGFEEEFPTPYDIIPEKTKITYINGLLDITTYMTDEAKNNRIDIND